MKYLFDTNVWIAIHRGNQRVADRWREVGADDVFLCSPVFAELYVGVLKSERRQENMKFVDDIAFQHDSLYFGITEAARFAQLSDAMRRSGESVKTMDLQIAAIAFVHGLRLVTHDVSDFSRIPGVEVEDWQA